MITIFKIFENYINRKKNIGDYVKLNENSGFINDPIIMNNIYIITNFRIDYEEDEIGVKFLEISSIFNNVKLDYVAPHHVILVTEDEIEEMRIKLQAKKYNL